VPPNRRHRLFDTTPATVGGALTLSEMIFVFFSELIAAHSVDAVRC
jgi:hypothetical protein